MAVYGRLVYTGICGRTKASMVTWLSVYKFTKYWTGHEESWILRVTTSMNYSWTVEYVTFHQYEYHVFKSDIKSYLQRINGCTS